MNFTLEEITEVIDAIKQEYNTDQESAGYGAHHTDWLNAKEGFEILLEQLKTKTK